MAQRAKRNIKSLDFARFYEPAHAAGVLDEKTKRLMHLALVLAFKCEPCVILTLEKARAIGASEEEIYETIQVAGAVGAGVVLAMADRAQTAVESEHHWWEERVEAGV
jgi:AhpD family alkylhydroperoxidase